MPIFALQHTRITNTFSNPPSPGGWCPVVFLSAVHAAFDAGYVFFAQRPLYGVWLCVLSGCGAVDLKGQPSSRCQLPTQETHPNPCLRISRTSLSLSLSGSVSLSLCFSLFSLHKGCKPKPKHCIPNESGWRAH